MDERMALALAIQALRHRGLERADEGRAALEHQQRSELYRRAAEAHEAAAVLAGKLAELAEAQS